MLGFLFRKKNQKKQVAESVGKQENVKTMSAKNESCDDLVLDDSELGSNVNFDDQPLTREQMRKVDMTV